MANETSSKPVATSAETVAIAKAAYLRGQYDLADSLLTVMREAQVHITPELQGILERIVKTGAPSMALALEAVSR